MAEDRTIPTCRRFAVITLTVAALWPAPGVAAVDTPALTAYARARLADNDGALTLATANYRIAFDADPASLAVALRAYRQAIASGDMVLAVRTARALDAAEGLPRDGALLLTVDALIRKDWASARAMTSRIAAEQNFAFLAPILTSWITLGEGAYVPPIVGPTDKGAALTRRYINEHAALQALSLGRTDEAIKVIDVVMAMRPTGLAGFRIYAAERLATLGQRDKAITLLPESAPGVAALRAQIVAGKKMKAPPLTPAQGVGRLLARLSDDVAAADDARSVAMTLARFAVFADPTNAEARVGLAQQLMETDRAGAALTELERVPAKSPFRAVAQDVTVQALAEAGAQDDAITLAQALAARPDAGPVQYQRLGGVLADAGRYDAAAASFEKAKAAYPADTAPWSLWLLLGGALERAGRWDESRAALEEAARLAPNEAVVLNYLGYAQVERRQNVPAALALLQKASKLKPDDPSITDSLGWAHFIAGDSKTAVPVLERAAIGAPDDATINEHLGDALWTVGRRFEARYAWAAARPFAEDKALERLDAKMTEGLRPEYAAP